MNHPSPGSIRAKWSAQTRGVETIAGAFAARLLLVAVMLAMPGTVRAQYGYTTKNGQATITAYDNTFPGLTVTIPSVINGLPVVAIGNNAFQACPDVTNVVLPSSITSLGRSSFASCANITTVTIGDSVTNIGDYAFSLCTKLTSVTLGKGVATMGVGVFEESRSLIGIIVDPSNASFSSTDGILFDNQGSLITYPAAKTAADYSIPDSVTTIQDYAFFACPNLTNITIPASVTTIGRFTFEGCTSLATANLPASISSIGIYAFTGCTGLANVVIPNGIAMIQDDTFWNCRSLTNAVIPDSVTTLGAEAFRGCSKLRSIVLPPALASLGVSSFRGCSNLTSVLLPASLTTFGDDALADCPALKAAYFMSDIPKFGADPFRNCNNDFVCYYLPGTQGWDNRFLVFAGRSPAVWYPAVQTRDSQFGLHADRFGFNIQWAPDHVVVVEVSSDLARPNWTPVSTNTLTGGSSYFSEFQTSGQPRRFYRLRAQ